MNKPNSPMPYVSVYCWKCKTQNNWAKTTSCRNCGSFLKASETRNDSSPYSESFFDNVAVKSFIRVAVLSALFIAGFAALYSYRPAAPSYKPYVSETSPGVFQTTALEQRKIEIPAGSWYQPSIWNFYRANPSVREILEKNNDATSKTLKPSDLQTVSLKGNISAAFIGCHTNECFEKEKKDREDQILQYRLKNPYYHYSTNDFSDRSAFKPPPPQPQLNDQFNSPAYIEIGRMEIHVKRPDKAYRKTFADLKRESKTVEVIDATNGATGWRRKTATEHRAVTETSLGELAADELDELKLSASSIWQNGKFKEEDLSFSDIQTINEKVNFVVRHNDRGKTETLFFDAVSGLLTKVESDEGASYLYPYADYKGVKFPAAIYFRRVDKDGRLIWMKLENLEWSFNEPIEDAIFEKPVS